MARDRPSPYGKGGRAECIARSFAIRRSQTTEYCSAGACPPRSLHGEGNLLAGACGMRGPSPYVKERRFFTGARGLSPRRWAIYETPSIKISKFFTFAAELGRVNPAIRQLQLLRNDSFQKLHDGFCLKNPVVFARTFRCERRFLGVNIQDNTAHEIPTARDCIAPENLLRAL